MFIIEIRANFMQILFIFFDTDFFDLKSNANTFHFFENRRERPNLQF